jgi:hypothetical protein
VNPSPISFTKSPKVATPNAVQRAAFSVKPKISKR